MRVLLDNVVMEVAKEHGRRGGSDWVAELVPAGGVSRRQAFKTVLIPFAALALMANQATKDKAVTREE